MKTIVRQPKQERAIEKKNKIITAGYQLFSERGYFSCTTPDIAKRAGVSTGIVYGYFNDKHDILLCVLEIYIKEVASPLMEIMKSVEAPVNIGKLITDLIDKTIEMHKAHKTLHETLHSLAATDKEVAAAFMSLENHVTSSVSKMLPDIGINTSDPAEKVHLAMNLIQSFSHEYVFDNHPYIDYEAMYKLVCGTITKFFG